MSQFITQPLVKNINTRYQSHTFKVNISNFPLTTGDEIYIKFKLYRDPTLTLYNDNRYLNDFTASFKNKAEAIILSTTPSTGYAGAFCNFFDSASMAVGTINNQEIIFNTGLSGFHDNNYTFEPNPVSGSMVGAIPFASSSLFNTYGNVDYEFKISPFDIILIYLEDGTYVEYRVVEITKQNSLVRILLDKPMKDIVKNNVATEKYTRFLVLKRVEDETNAFITFQKNPGQTSYGFLIPNDLGEDILKNIDVITKEVKQKLLADQQGNTGE